MDQKLKLKIAVPCALIIIAYIAGSLSFYEPALTSQEKKVFSFIPESYQMPGPKSIELQGDLKSPIKIQPQRQYATNVAARSSGRKTTAEKKKVVTMIIVGSVSKMAVIDGTLVRGGDMIDDMIVKRIENNRVLVSNANEQQWLHVEGTQ